MFCAILNFQTRSRASYVEIIKGVVELTPYGKAFVKSCT